MAQDLGLALWCGRGHLFFVMPENPVTQEFILRLIRKIILWCAFLAVAVLVGYQIYRWNKHTNEIFDKTSAVNAQTISGK